MAVAFKCDSCGKFIDEKGRHNVVSVKYNDIQHKVIIDPNHIAGLGICSSSDLCNECSTNILMMCARKVE